MALREPFRLTLVSTNFRGIKRAKNTRYLFHGFVVHGYPMRKDCLPQTEARPRSSVTPFASTYCTHGAHYTTRACIGAS